MDRNQVVRAWIIVSARILERRRGLVDGVRNRRVLSVLSVLMAGLGLAAVIACGGGGEREKLYIGGIPDQDLAILEQRFDGLAEYLSHETDLDVEYVPASDYAGVVTAFKNDDIQLGWYGGLTGVQARQAVPDAQAIAQRPRDQRFRSVFIARKELGIESLEDLRGHSVTFGSESSTSGYLMPLHFLKQDGLDPGEDFSQIGFSGSHDATWKKVEAGAFDAGALNAAIWDKRVEEGKVNLDAVEAFWRTPEYYDYHWVVRGDLDEKYGEGTTEKIGQALLQLGQDGDPEEEQVLEAFQDEAFIPTSNENYGAIESVARDLGIVQ